MAKVSYTTIYLVLMIVHVRLVKLEQPPELALHINPSESELDESTLDIEPEPDPDRENEIKLKSVGSLESLLLEAVHLGGAEVCSSPFARGVMLGTWRNGTPEAEELRASKELRKTCYNALLRTPSPMASPVAQSVGVGRSVADRVESLPNTEISTSDDLTFALISVPAPAVRPMGRLAPSPRQNSGTVAAQAVAADPEVMQKMNEIVKDKSAECKPRKVPVEIPMESGITWLPPCALVERCGGCCKHESLKCVPIPEGITMYRKKVVAMDSKGTLLKIKQVSIEKHNKCKCQCKVQASDCNPLQTYDGRNCRCVCKQTKPTGTARCNASLYWDERSCKCRCPQITECSTGSYFSSETCKCVTAIEIIKDESKRRGKDLGL